MKRMFIVTGAQGHLGSTIIRYLQYVDCEVRGLILPSEQAENRAHVTYFHGDVTQPASLEPLFADIDGYEVFVIHAAGLISIDNRLTPQLYAVNVTGTRHVIAQCIRSRVRRLVYISSVHAIPELPKGTVMAEIEHFSADAVVGAYAKTKAEATQAVLDAARDGLDAVVVHPSGIIGPYDDGKNHIVQLIDMYITGRLPAGVQGGYDFVDVRDVARGCLRAAIQGRMGNCYILANRYCTVMELLNLIRHEENLPRKRCLPIALARAGVPLLEWMARCRRTRPLFTRYALYTLTSNSCFSHEKATAELGYRPRDMRTTIVDTVAYLRGQAVALEVETG